MINSNFAYNYATQGNMPFVKYVFSSKSVLLVGILGCVNALLSMTSTILVIPILEYIEKNLNDFILTANLDIPPLNMQSMLNVIPSAITSLIMIACVFIPFFIIYFKSKNNSPASSPTFGLKWLKVLAVLGIIYFVILILMSILLIIISMVLLSSSHDSEQFIVSFGSFLLAISISTFISLFIIMFYFSTTLSFINSSIKSCSGPILTKGAKGFGVFNIIASIYIALSFLSSIFGVFLFTASPDVLIDILGLNVNNDKISRMLITTINDVFDMILPIMIIGILMSLIYAIIFFLLSRIGFTYSKEATKLGVNFQPPFNNYTAQPQMPIYQQPVNNYTPQPQAPTYQQPVNNYTPQPQAPKPQQPVNNYAPQPQAPKPQQPVESPKPQQPVESPKPQQPVENPKPQQPVENPKPQQPVDNQNLTQQ